MLVGHEKSVETDRQRGRQRQAEGERSDEDRNRYVAGLATVTKPGGRIFLECFSDEEPGDAGPRRISKTDLKSAFAEGWAMESIEPVRIEVRPDLPPEMSLSPGGPKAWFAVIRRVT